MAGKFVPIYECARAFKPRASHSSSSSSSSSSSTRPRRQSILTPQDYLRVFHYSVLQTAIRFHSPAAASSASHFMLHASALFDEYQFDEVVSYLEDHRKTCAEHNLDLSVIDTTRLFAMHSASSNRSKASGKGGNSSSSSHVKRGADSGRSARKGRSPSPSPDSRRRKRSRSSSRGRESKTHAKPKSDSALDKWCRNFNNGSCTYKNCKREHSCIKCGKTDHGIVNCK